MLNENQSKKWSSALCEFDPESCILAHVLPCHIYAKIYGSCYLFNFLYYGLFCSSIYTFYYWLSFVTQNKCADSLTDQCFGLGDNCSDYYMLIDGVPARCIFNEICYHSDTSCVVNYKKINLFLSLGGSISYFILCLLNYFLREKVKKEYAVEGEYDSCAVTICSPCGLAQEYRQYESETKYKFEDIYINV